MTTWSLTSRWIPPRTNASTRPSTRWRPHPTARCGAHRWAFRARSCGSYRARIRRRQRSQSSTSCRYATPSSPVNGFSPRGGDVDRNGVFWAALASGQLASFDRRKCKGPLNGPKATGQHCPEGWSFYVEPLPRDAQGVARSRKCRRPVTSRGWTSSTRSGSGRTCRSTRATHRKRCSRSRTAPGSCCEFRIRWASTRSGWTGVSMIPMPAGRDVASGPR